MLYHSFFRSIRGWSFYAFLEFMHFSGNHHGFCLFNVLSFTKLRLYDFYLFKSEDIVDQIPFCDHFLFKNSRNILLAERVLISNSKPEQRVLSRYIPLFNKSGVGWCMFSSILGDIAELVNLSAFRGLMSDLWRHGKFVGLSHDFSISSNTWPLLQRRL